MTELEQALSPAAQSAMDHGAAFAPGDGLEDSLVDPLAEAETDAVQMEENSRAVRQTFTKDVENPRHVVDASESDKSGFR